VANLNNQITLQAFLYDLLINDRDIIVYKPVFSIHIGVTALLQKSSL
jgi:hypothetical protein